MGKAEHLAEKDQDWMPRCGSGRVDCVQGGVHVKLSPYFPLFCIWSVLFGGCDRGGRRRGVFVLQLT